MSSVVHFTIKITVLQVLLVPFGLAKLTKSHQEQSHWFIHCGFTVSTHTSVINKATRIKRLAATEGLV